MNKQSKVLILSLVFILPVATFLFLKFFGKNQFEVAVLKETNVVMSCDTELTSVLTDQIDIVLVRSGECQNSQCSFEKDEFKRVAQRYADKALRFTILSPDTIDINWKGNNLSAYTVPGPLSLGCVGLAESANSFVVFDQTNRLRGVYEVSREETDRMILELDILMRYE